jgi:hypothetical protein
MIYPSWLHTHKGADYNDLNDLPLVRWKKTGKDAPSQWEPATHENAEFIWENWTPSQKDVEGVKKMYPYQHQGVLDWVRGWLRVSMGLV